MELTKGQSENIFKTIYNEIPALLHSVNRDGSIQEVNNYWLQTLGYKRQEIIGKDITDFMDLWYRNIVRETIKSLFDLKKPIKVECRFIKKDGSHMDVILSSTLVNIKGQDQSLSVMTVVTEGRRAKMEFKEAEDNYRFLFENIYGIVCLYRYDGSILKISSSVEDLLGYSMKEIMNMDTYEVFYKNDIKKIKKAVKDSLKGKINQIDYRTYHKDGSLIWLESTIQTKFDEKGRVRYVMTSSRNISERKQNEAKMRQNEAFLHEVEKVSKICYWICDYKTGTIEWSNGFFELFNIEKSETKPHCFQNLLQYVHPDDLRLISKKYKPRKKLINANLQDDSSFRFRILKDGKIRHLKGSSGRHISSGKIFGILQEITEISENERNLDNAQKIANIGSFDWDTISNKLTCSDQFYKIYGRSSESFGSTLEDFVMCLHPDSKKNFMKELHKAMDKGGIFRTDEKIIRPDNSIRVLSTIGKVTLDESGKPVRIQGTCRDITEKQEQEQLLIESEKRLREAQKIAKIGYWTYSTFSKFFNLSDELNNILCFKNKKTLSQTELVEIIHPQDRDRVTRDWTSVVKGNSSKIEYRVVIKDEIKWIYVESHPNLIVKGRTHSITGILQDITTRKLAELKLKDSENRYRLLFDHAFDGIMIFDYRHLKYMDCNKKTLDLFKVSKAQFLTFNHKDLSADEQNGGSSIQMIKLKERSFHKYPFKFEWKAKKSNGILFDIEVTVMMFDRERSFFIFLIRDITESKEQEEVLKSSEERYRNLYNNTPVMLHSTDQEGKLIEVSKYWLRKMGYEKHEVIGKHIYDFLQDDCREYTKNIAIPSSFEYERLDDTIYKFVTKEGKVFDASLSAIVIHDTNGKYSLATTQDITAVKMAERALINSEKKFRQLVSNSPTILYQYSYKEKKDIFYSEKVKDIIGYDAKYLIEHPKKWMNSIHKEDLLKVKETLASAKEDNRVEIEYRIKNKTGVWKWVKNLSIGLEKSSSDLILSGIIIDISKEKNAIDALRESEMKLHTIINTIPNPIFYKDLNGYYLGVNDNFAKFIGVPKDKIIASSISDVYTGPNVDKLSQLDNELIQSKHHSIVSNQKLLSENSIRDVIIYKSKWKDTEGKLLGIAGTFVDVTDIKETARRLQNIITSLPGIVFRACYDFKSYKMEFMSDQTTEIIGFSPNDFIPYGDLSFLDIVQESDREAIIKRLKQIPRSYIETKFRVTTKDKNEKWLWERCLILIQDDLIIKEGILMDITDTVNMEDRIISATLQTEDNERRRISRTIHDGVQQVLISALLSLQAIENEIMKCDERIQKYYAQSYSLLKSGLDETREIAHKLMPKAIEDFGIVKSLETMIQMLNSTTNTSFNFYHNLQDQRFNKEIEMNIYRICQEATNNIVKYAGASEAHIQIVYHSKLISITIEDDGKGFEIGETRLLYKGFGVSSMRSRATAISGTLEIESRPNHGTMVVVEVPVDKLIFKHSYPLLS